MLIFPSLYHCSANANHEHLTSLSNDHVCKSPIETINRADLARMSTDEKGGGGEFGGNKGNKPEGKVLGFKLSSENIFLIITANEDAVKLDSGFSNCFFHLPEC